MTRTELIAQLKTLDQPQMIEIKYASTPSMRETGNEYMTALKHQHVQGFINFNYEGLVNNEMPDGYRNFKAGNRVWGVRVPKSPLVENAGEFYLEVLVERELSPPRYTHQGQAIPDSLITPFLKTKPESQQGLVRPRDFKINGIEWIRVGNQGYNITDG
jgi:hypothetical protein